MNDITVIDQKDNMKLWNSMKEVPAQYLKPILGGRLKGLSDISPQWRLMVLTEQFGPIGFGWYYEIADRGIQTSQDGQVSAHVQINLYVKVAGEWSRPIPGLGGSMLVEKEKNGPYHSDEAFKMALTDALSVACKSLGIAASVYLSHGGKYNPPPVEQSEPADLTRELDVINEAPDLDSLKDAYTKFYQFWDGNRPAQRRLADAKDARKKVLSVANIFNGEVKS